MNFDTVFPLYVYIICAVLIVLSLGITWFRYFGQLKVSYLSAITVCRFAAIALALLFALRPYSVDESPDVESFNIKVLVDVSKSMDSADCNGASRIDTARNIIQDSNWFKAIQGKYNISFQTFSSRMESYPKDGQLKSLIGGTDISKPLDNSAESASVGGLGGIIVLTDGQENIGNATEAAKSLRALGVPVTTVGIGGEKELEDLVVTFQSVPKTNRKNKEFELLVKIRKNMQKAFSKEIVLSQGDLEISRQLIEFPEGVSEQIVAFSQREYTAGFKNYRVYAEPETEEMIKSNNVDYAAVEITDDEIIKILYFSGNLSWEYKFLDKLCDDSENLQLTALVRTGNKAWYYYAGKEEKQFEVFPETTELIEYDLIIFDLGSEYLIDAQIAENIEKFAFDKGGGIMFMGRKQKDSLFANILPVSQIRPESASGKKVLDIPDQSILVPRSKKDLTDLNNILILKGGKQFYSSSISDLKKSARADVRLKGSGGKVLVSSLYYGSGRSVYMGIETWPWKMNPKNDGENYSIFWKRILTWLSSSSVDQMKIIPAYRKFPAGESMEMSLDLLDPDFEPSVTAKVTVSVKTPSGDLQELKLPASLDIEGRFALDYVPEDIGEYQISVKAKFVDDTEMSKKVSFLASETSGENGTLPLNRRILEDISRITGGSYIHWSDTGSADELPLYERIPVIQSRTYFFNSWFTMLLILLFFGGEWFLRRRIGLS